MCGWSRAGKQEGDGGQAEAATEGEGRRSRVKEFQIPALGDLGWWLGNNTVSCRHSAQGTVSLRSNSLNKGSKGNRTGRRLWKQQELRPFSRARGKGVRGHSRACRAKPAGVSHCRMGGR